MTQTDDEGDGADDLDRDESEQLWGEQDWSTEGDDSSSWDDDGSFDTDDWSSDFDSTPAGSFERDEPETDDPSAGFDRDRAGGQQNLEGDSVSEGDDKREQVVQRPENESPKPGDAEAIETDNSETESQPGARDAPTPSPVESDDPVSAVLGDPSDFASDTDSEDSTRTVAKIKEARDDGERDDYSHINLRERVALISSGFIPGSGHLIVGRSTRAFWFFSVWIVGGVITGVITLTHEYAGYGHAPYIGLTIADLYRIIVKRDAVDSESRSGASE